MSPAELVKWYEEKWSQCECGNPEDVTGFLFRIMEWLASGKTPHEHPLASQSPDVSALFESFLKQMDNANLVAHGSSWRGSWLDYDGPGVFEGMKKYGTDPDDWYAALPADDDRKVARAG